MDKKQSITSNAWALNVATHVMKQEKKDWLAVYSKLS